jgi:hypothetical protein
MAHLPQMNSKEQNDNLHQWLHLACIEGTETNLGIRTLKPYGVDLTDARMSCHGLASLAILCDSDRAQTFICNCSEETRAATWGLLRSWGVGSTPKRLELRARDVWRLLEDHLVIMQNKMPVVSTSFMSFLIDGDEEAPGYDSIPTRRMNLFTFMHLCLEFDHKMFAELWKTVVGPPADKEIITEHLRKPCKFRPVSEDIEAMTVMEIHTAKVAQEERRAEKRRAKARRARKARSERKRLARVLTERNADVDDAVCVICLDEPCSIRFGPCQHVCCCAGCAEVLDTCCLCRRVIDTQEVANPVHSTVKSTKAKTSPTLGRLTTEEACLKVLSHRCKTARQAKDLLYEILQRLEKPLNK